MDLAGTLFLACIPLFGAAIVLIEDRRVMNERKARAAQKA